MLKRDAASYMSDFAQTVKQQADIVKVIGGYIRLRKSGAQNYSGLCPFHKEKSPSFNVHASKQFYHCFGCGQSGDIFSFVSKIENLSFPEAVRAVAVKCGIPLPKREYNSPEEAAEAGTRRKLLDLHEIATVWFEEQLRSPEGALAREYLAGRGVAPEAIKLFRIGYAPDNFNALRDYLSPKTDAETLRISGLVSWKQQDSEAAPPQANSQPARLYDRFRKRIMFPIANESGRVIAFTARLLESSGKPSGEKAGPKYLNSPETPLYSKGQVLFNLDKAKAQIRSMEFALLVEGQMDCISVFMRGIQNVIATSGTAFTEQQVGLLRRQTINVVVNFDPDAAGANAAEKSIALLTEEGFTIKVVTLDGGLDPDRFIRERGVEAYAAAIRGARRQSDYLIDRARQQFPGSGSDAKIKAMNYLLPHIRRIPQKLERDQFAHDAAQKLGIDSAVLREEIRQAALKRQDHIKATASDISAVESVLLRALAATPDCWSIAAEAINKHPERFERLSTYSALKSLAIRMTSDPMTVIEEPSQRMLLAKVLQDADRIPKDASKGAGTDFEQAKEVTPELVANALDGIHRAWLDRHRSELMKEIEEAERAGDLAHAISLGQQKLEIELERRKVEFGGATPAQN
jgi:DNA primase